MNFAYKDKQRKEFEEVYNDTLGKSMRQWHLGLDLAKEDYQQIVRLENHELNHELCVQQQENFSLKRELAKYKVVTYLLCASTVASIYILLTS